MNEEIVTKTNQLFNDSDSDYVGLELDRTPPKKKLKKVTVSPRVSRQMRKSGMQVEGQHCIEFKSSPMKSPRNLKQQLMLQRSSPRKQHVPLTPEKRRDPYHVPYYLLNFECILRGVIEETDDKELFDDEELKLVSKFWGLPLDSRKLFVRLFQRKHAWIPKKSISYDEIQDLDDHLKSLQSQGFLASNEDLTDLESVLNVLSAPAVKQLCKNMNIASNGTQQKKNAMEALMAHSKKKSFFSNANMTQHILKKARLLMDSAVYRLPDPVRCIFMRILSLYSLSNWWDERENESRGSQQTIQLTTILLQNTGKVVFPLYEIQRQRKIFRCRQELLDFESVCGLEASISELIANKNWVEMVEPVNQIEQEFDNLLQDESMISHAESLPPFLRKFTRGSVLAYVLSKGVEMYEKLKNYQKAIDLLRKLIQQKHFLLDYKGHWYERLVLDLDQHLKNPSEALNSIKDALEDSHVQEARLLSLCQRVKKLSLSKKNGLKKSNEMIFTLIMTHPRYRLPDDPKELVIQGKMMPKNNLPGEKTVFVWRDNLAENENELLCSVEEFVKEHYKRKLGYTNGLHAEGSVCHAIVCILFWDIIFDTCLPDVFRSPHQSAPLDFNCGSFYLSRKELIDERLEFIAKNSMETLSEMVTQRWQNYSHMTACPVNWELFTSLTHFQGLFKCFSNFQLSGLCKRLMTNHRHTRSGFPDLTVWDTAANRVAFVEVKGPNDRLSNKQILWLEYLNNLGIEAVVCHIEPHNGKRLKFSPKKSSKSPAKKIKLACDSDDDFQ